MCTMAQVLEQFGEAYSQRHAWTPDQAKVAACIRQCRTEALGCYELACQVCGTRQCGFCACRNRHCPHCQREASAEWCARQHAALLPVPYFHLVFTLPHELNGWVRLHPRELYGMLFDAAWATLKQFGADPKRLDGQLGATMVLHTWGQQLDQHVHLHGLIPAGAWSETQQQWHPARSNYLFPVRALARVYRGKLVSALSAAARASKLSRLTDQVEVKRVLSVLMHKEWVVYTKACHGKPERVLEYLSRYTHRIALSERRLLGIDNGRVALSWKDYRDHRQKVMQLDGVELLRRFLQHVLPGGFMRIRHYGILSNRWRAQRQEEINAALAVKPASSPKAVDAAFVNAREPGCWRCPGCQGMTLRLVSIRRPLRVQRE